MKLLFGSIEIEKCGNTENKNKATIKNWLELWDGISYKCSDTNRYTFFLTYVY